MQEDTCGGQPRMSALALLAVDRYRVLTPQTGDDEVGLSTQSANSGEQPHEKKRITMIVKITAITIVTRES